MSAFDVMTFAEQFHAWALDPVRTNEELYTVELLLEAVDQVWRATDPNAPPLDWAAYQRHQTRRLGNPAYRVVLDRESLDRSLRLWAGVKKLENGPFEDRPLRDLSAVGFFPQLEEVALSCELTDLVALTALQKLRKLTLNDDTVNDVRMLAALPALARLDLRLGEPWPMGVSALEELPVLRELNYAGNLLVWRGAFRLPVVETAVFDAGFHGNTPLRDLGGLPEMPQLTRLKVTSTASLRGLERFPNLVELELAGPFQDLSPLAGLAQVRALKLTGERFLDLRPVARMAGLRTLELHRSRGLDVDPLAEAPKLREVSAPRCAVLETELATINAALGWVDEAAYVLPDSRQLAPPRLISCAFRSEEYLSLPPKPDAGSNLRKTAFGDDPLPAKAEDRWFARGLQQRLSRLLSPGWGHMDVDGAVAYVTLTRAQDLGRLREVVQALREVRAWARFPWECILFYEPASPGESAEDVDDEALDEEVSERAEWVDIRQRRAERQKYLEIEHRMRLRSQQGLPPEPVPEEPDTQGLGAAAGAAEPGDGGERPSGGFVLLVDEPVLWVHRCDRDAAAAAFGQEPEEWHLLPEPPEERPRR